MEAEVKHGRVLFEALERVDRGGEFLKAADVAGWLREQLPGMEVYVGRAIKSVRVALMNS